MSERSCQILLVEDKPADAALIGQSLEERSREVSLMVVHDGQAAVDLLIVEKPDERSYRPDLIVLDLNLPLLGGFEVLQAIRGDERTREIPVFIVTQSALEEDIERANGLQVEGYITKPFDVDGYAEIGEKIEAFLADTKNRKSADSELAS